METIYRRFLKYIPLAILLTVSGLRAEELEDPDELFRRQRLQNRAQVAETYQRNRETHADNPDTMVRHGLLADRNEKVVRIRAEATGLAGDAPVEFFVIAEDSGHDYEALAVSFAQPSDIHEALTFIGMEPGAPYNPALLRYWPKGERVRMRFEWETDDGDTKSLFAEDLILDVRTDQPLPVEGLVFVGSEWITEDDGERFYASDRLGPLSIASDYNETWTVLDVPRQAEQGATYRSLYPHPDRQPAPGTMIEITLTPEFTDGRRRVADLQLTIGARGEDPAVTYTLTERGADEPLHDGDELQNALAAMNRLSDEGRELYLSLTPDRAVTLAALRDACALIREIDTDRGVRMEPPPPGHLYYRAFLPDESHRERANRPSQVLELHLNPDESGTLRGAVIHVKETRAEDMTWTLTEESFDVDSADTLTAVLDEIDHRLPVLLIFAEPEMTYGELLDFVLPAIDGYTTVYVFLS